MGAKVELVREMLEMFNRSGAEAAVEFGLAPDVIWHAAPQWPGKATYEGRAGALELIEEWTASFQDYRWDLDEVHDAGDMVLTLVHHRGTSAGTLVEAPVGAVWRVDGGAVAETWFFFSWDEARAAAGIDQSIESRP